MSTELDTFILKFRQLWHSGYGAHLNLDTYAGQAWVGLRLRLGEAPGVHHPQANQNSYKKARNSPSRQRRREKRAAERQNHQAEEASDLEKAEEVNDLEKAEEANDLEKAEEVNETVDNLNQAEKAIGFVETDLVNEAEEALANVNRAEEATVEAGNDESVSTEHEKDEEVIDIDTTVQPVDTIVTAAEESVLPEVVVVHAIAVFTECPEETLNAEYGNSLKKFIFSEDHLERNIASYNTEVLSSHRMRNNLFTHSVAVKINVRTRGLWDSPRKYIWKHFIDNQWTKNNGAKIKLIKIHVKA